jgi:hypothetical protein
MPCPVVHPDRRRGHRGQVVPHLGRRHHLDVPAEAEHDPGRRIPDLHTSPYGSTTRSAGAKRILPPDIRAAADIPFGPVVEVPADATPYTQLAAWLGRHP